MDNINHATPDSVDWDKGHGLVPAIIQHSQNGQVLMLGYMSKESLAQTLATGQVTFYSRSRKRLWTKGETSGNTLELKKISVDCDQDTVLVQAVPHGPTCHTGSASCFGERQDPAIGFLNELEQIIESRKSASPESSYTATLFNQGIKRCAQKVGEEAVEVALAAMAHDRVELLKESADLIYHLLVVLSANDCTLTDVVEVLQQRHSIAS